MKRQSDSPPGPGGLPGLQALAFRRDPLGFLTRLSQRYGDISSFRIAPHQVFLLNHPDYIRDFFLMPAENFRKGPALQRAKRLLGEGLLTSDGNYHRRQRRLMQPAFHRHSVARHAELIASSGNEFTSRWQHGESRDLHFDMRRLTLSIIGRLLFSTDVEEAAADSITLELTASLERLSLISGRRNSLVTLLQKMPFIQPPQRFQQARQNLDAAIYRLLDDRKQRDKDSGDLVSMLLSARDDEGGMSDQQVRDELMTLFQAGHETTANALTWTWFLLSQNPDAEAKLHLEIDHVLGGRLPTLDDLGRLPYAEMVLLEAMRLYPPAWMVARLALKDFEVGGYILPASSLLLVSQYAMHRNAGYFPCPDHFDPERWTTEARNSRPQFSYFPFGGGHRRCIGEALALLEGVLLITTIASRWRMRLLTNRPVKPQPLLSLRPKGGILMKLERRFIPSPGNELH